MLDGGPVSETLVRGALPLVEAVLGGTNGCMFAFGPTGSGKTYSMLGLEGGQSAVQDGCPALLASEGKKS